MSDFVLCLKKHDLSKPEDLLFSEKLGPTEGCILNVYGSQKTFSIIRKSQDWLCSIGYTCFHNMPSMNDTLNRILLSFDEKKIGDIKRQLVGQYILIIRKDKHLFIFSDFLGARNIFYSKDSDIFCSSFSFLERSIGIDPNDLNRYKLIEYFAVREVLYPCWLGRETINKKINWLLPYEYIKINIDNYDSKINFLNHFINNKKESDVQVLSEKLIDSLELAIYREEFKNSVVCSSITGGRDSRLVATMVARKYPRCNYRIAISSINKNSLKDFEVAKKICKINNISLDIYELNLPDDEKIFKKITENFTPAFNIIMTPIFTNAYKYALGFGGVYGTELFTPIEHKNMGEYLTRVIAKTRKVLTVNEHFWPYFSSSLSDQIKEIKAHYYFENDDDRDYIRLLHLLITARYSSFIISAFNQFGYHLEPFGSFPVIELAFKISPELWGNKRSIVGDALIERAAQSKLSPRAARVIAYSSYRPATPFSIWSSPIYLWGYARHLSAWVASKIVSTNKKEPKEIMPGMFYASDGWERYYLEKAKAYF